MGDFDESQIVIIQSTSDKLISGNVELINGEPMMIFRDYTKTPDDYPGLMVYNFLKH